jgi:hypothetical protein
MADNRTVSGSIEVEQDGRHATALKLMEKIGNHEYKDKNSEQGSRDYWLKLYVQCVNATYRHLPPELK